MTSSHYKIIYRLRRSIKEYRGISAACGYSLIPDRSGGHKPSVLATSIVEWVRSGSSSVHEGVAERSLGRGAEVEVEMVRSSVEGSNALPEADLIETATPNMVASF